MDQCLIHICAQELAKAEEMKAKGNDFFKKEQYTEALVSQLKTWKYLLKLLRLTRTCSQIYLILSQLSSTGRVALICGNVRSCKIFNCLTIDQSTSSFQFRH